MSDAKPAPVNPAEEIERKLRPSSKDEERALKWRATSADDIVNGLRHSDAMIRKQAIMAAFPGRSAMLIVTDKKTSHVTASDNLDAPMVFQALLFVAQRVGRFLGLDLGWVPDPKAQAEAYERAQNELVVAHEGDVPPAPKIIK